MLFNSIDFAVFLPIVFMAYWFLASKRIIWQNNIILIASYVFYGLWSWKFLILILFSTMVDFSIGYLLSKEKNKVKRRVLLWISITVNIGLLAFFKYYNFFIDNLVNVFYIFGHKLNITTLKVILPVGISFYTFQTLSYTIDIYREKLNPTKDFIIFSSFVSFFPQLVAGPIERAKDLLPQFSKERTFDFETGKDALKQILWGLFKKIVIADNCAIVANQVFENYSRYNGSTLWLGVVFFAFQIYGDFSGYSDIAIGTAKLFGFELKKNFNTPYFSRNVAEFWRRWHISLNTWFRDYVYIPLGGSNGGMKYQIRNIFAVFLLSGLWHGANWTFIIWGFLNALYFVPLLVGGKNRSYLDTVAENRLFPSFKESLQMLLTFVLITISWVFFRADNLEVAFLYLTKMFSSSVLSLPSITPFKTMILLLVFLIIEWLGRTSEYALKSIVTQKKGLTKYVFYFALTYLLFCFEGKEQEFIYFQF